MFRRLLWLGLFLLAGSGFAWALWPRAVEVEVAQIDRQDIVVLVEEEGRSQIREVFTVSAPIAGRMARLSLHAGDTVRKGETVVARIRPAPPPLLDARTQRMAEAARDAAEAALGLAQAELAHAEAQASFAVSELERASALANRGALPTRQLEQARLEAAVAQAAVKSADANLLMRERELERAQAALIQAEANGADGPCCVEILAPSSGRVLRVLAESEQIVVAGAPLLEIGDPHDIEIVVDLLSSDAVRVEQGAASTVRDWGGTPLSAKVRRIDPSAVTRVSALGIEEQRITAILALEGDPKIWANLGDGYRVTVGIEVWRAEHVPAVSVAALFRSGAEWAVFRVVDGRAQLTKVVIGERTSVWAELLDGLDLGSVVILRPSDRIEDGMRVALPQSAAAMGWRHWLGLERR